MRLWRRPKKEEKIATMKLSFVLYEDSALVDERYLDISDDDEVDEFIQIFMRDEYRGDAVVINSRDLCNRRAYRIDKHSPYAIVDPADVRIRKQLNESCTHLGSASAFFFPKNESAFLEEYMERKYFDRVFLSLTIDELKECPFISATGLLHLQQYMQDFGKSVGTIGFTFTHDAEHFCVMRVEP